MLGMSKSFFDRLPLVEPDNRAGWRAWLAEHHETEEGAWCVIHKKNSPKSNLQYEDVAEECLCFGWIDSKPNKLDEHRYKLLTTPRKPGSMWSQPNKERVERLMAEGLLLPAGLAKIKEAKADGSWDYLNDIDAMLVPPDLEAALAAAPGAKAAYKGFADSAKKGLLLWIKQAKTDKTRTKRIEAAAKKAAMGEVANQYVRKS